MFDVINNRFGTMCGAIPENSTEVDPALYTLSSNEGSNGRVDHGTSVMIERPEHESSHAGKSKSFLTISEPDFNYCTEFSM